MNTNTNTYVCTYVRMYVRTYVRTYARTYVRTYVRMYVRTYVRTFVPTYVRAGAGILSPNLFFARIPPRKSNGDALAFSMSTPGRFEHFWNDVDIRNFPIGLHDARSIRENQKQKFPSLLFLLKT